MTDLKMMKSLGVLISGAEMTSDLPEIDLLGSFAAAQEDYRALVLIHTWVQRNHDLIHVEALLSRLKNTKASGPLKLLAGALKATGRKRFDRILDLAKASRSKPTLNKYLSFATEIGQCSTDPAYAEFGLTISCIDLAAERKFRPRKFMIAFNPFFFCRTLFGVNWRADVAACFLTDNAKNPTEVAKFIGCSYDAAYRNYHDLLSVGWDKDVRKSFVSGL